jgi:acyl-CoA hydrolase
VALTPRGPAAALFARNLTRYIRPGDTVAWGQACAEPVTLTEVLAAERSRLSGVRCFSGISSAAAVSPRHCDHLCFASYTAAGANRAVADAGALRILPCHYSQLPDVLTAGPLRVDVVLLSLPPPAPDGSFGPGLGADYLTPLVGQARVVIAEVNDQLPDMGSGVRIRPEDVDVLVPVSRPPAEYPAPAPRATDDAIASHVAALVPDAATIQLGIGSMPSAVARRLLGHRDLGVHSGMITDAVAELIEAGVVTGARKSVDRGLVVTGFLMGSQPLLRLAATDRAITLRDTRYTHDPAVLAAQHRFVAINSATEVDLTGQANAETAAGRYVGGVGGAVDFARGAASSAGGIPILALPSTAVSPAGERVSRIVTRLGGPATLGRADAGVIVTEYGVADLRGLPLPERRERMLAIAHPDHRQALAADDQKENR